MGLNTRTYFYGTNIKTTFTVIANAPTCTSFNYSDWSACQSDGTQANCTSSVPSTCSGGIAVLSNHAAIAAHLLLQTARPLTCNNNYGTWNSINCTCSCHPDFSWSDQDRLPVTSKTATCNVFTYSDWSAGSSSGTQTRTVTSSSPSGCTVVALSQPSHVLMSLQLVIKIQQSQLVLLLIIPIGQPVHPADDRR